MWATIISCQKCLHYSFSLAYPQRWSTMQLKKAKVELPLNT
uniref:Uncharacterized protein n=1 Tax=Arundo donax TaxID=35708 RepID=A0A0A9B8D3_ARUDO